LKNRILIIDFNIDGHWVEYLNYPNIKKYKNKFTPGEFVYPNNPSIE